jgi:hypothetical protein
MKFIFKPQINTDFHRWEKAETRIFSYVLISENLWLKTK